MTGVSIGVSKKDSDSAASDTYKKHREVLTAIKELSKQTNTRTTRMRRCTATSDAFKDAKENDYRSPVSNP